LKIEGGFPPLFPNNLANGNHRMGPKQANFDGAEGIKTGSPQMHPSSVYRLKRGKNPIRLKEKRDQFRNMLIWYYPDDEDPKLLFCNKEGNWFNLSFDAIDIGNF